MAWEEKESPFGFFNTFLFILSCFITKMLPRIALRVDWWSKYWTPNCSQCCTFTTWIPHVFNSKCLSYSFCACCGKDVSLSIWFSKKKKKKKITPRRIPKPILLKWLTCVKASVSSILWCVVSNLFFIFSCEWINHETIMLTVTCCDKGNPRS